MERSETVGSCDVHQLLPEGVGQEAGQILGQLRDRSAVRLHADSVDGGVGPAAFRALPDGRANVGVRVQIERLGPVAPSHLEPLGHEVNADHQGGAP